MTIRNLDRLLAPRTIALVADLEPPGYKEQLLLQHLAAAPVGVRIYVVASRNFSAPGRLVPVATIADIPEAIDILLMARPPAAVPRLLTNHREPEIAVMVLLGFAGGAVPADLRETISRVAGQREIRLLGPNSIGCLLPHPPLNLSFHPRLPPAGRIALISQSGALITAVLEDARQRSTGFSQVVNLGTFIDIDFGDLIDWLGGDDRTTVVLLYVEYVRNVKKFLSACRSVARIKPVIALKSGRSPEVRRHIGRRSAATPGDPEVYECAFRRAGVITVETMDELLTAGIALAGGAVPAGDRCALITNSDALGSFALDHLIDRQLHPRPPSANLSARLTPLAVSAPGELPIDVGGTADSRQFGDAVITCLHTMEYDAIIVIMVINGFIAPHRIAARVREMTREYPGTVYYAWLGGSSFHRHQAEDFMRRGIPVHFSLEEALNAYAYGERYRRKREGMMAVVPQLDRTRQVDPDRLRVLLAPYAGALPTPLPAETAGRLLTWFGIHPAPFPEPPDHLRLRAGIRRDAEFGPCIYLGIGNPCAIFAADCALMLPPLNRLLARRLIERSPAGPALDDPARRGGVEDLLLTLSAIICQTAEVVTVDLELAGITNTLLGVVNAAITVQRATVTAPGHLVIMPYPNQYTRHQRLPDGTPVTIRPIRPEDEERHLAFFHSLSRRTNYYRFFSYRRKLDRAQLTRFTQIDYDREMAIIAVIRNDNGGEQTIGVSRLAYQPHSGRHEFAMVVADVWQGRGVGRLLMDRLLKIAADRQITTIHGTVLAENESMLAFCRRYGFQTIGHDGETIVLRLDLPAAENPGSDRPENLQPS
ncbi:MAG: GNAT family N-acetyltransferase [Deltaproteobacteria bacterium]|nr:GNAT family N-acetyltransferase [Candidatus Anaeroferrophillacea bacterium]